MKKETSRLDFLQAVKTPLGFFTLVVLVVEAILGITASFNQGTDRTCLIIGMLSLIFVLVIVVTLLAFFRPEALSGKRPMTHDIVGDELQNLSPAEKIARYRQLITQETRENLLLNFNVPEGYKPEISTIDKFTFGFCYPERWTFARIPEQFRYGYILDTESGQKIGFARNMNIVIDDISGVDFETNAPNMIEILYNKALEQVLSLMPMAKLVSHDKGVIFHGLPASRWRINWTPQDENKRELALYQIVVADKSRKNLYTISFTTTKDDFETSQRLFDNIANTFRI